MGELSIIEFIVYAVICYGSLMMLIISTIEDVPTTKSMAVPRAMYLIPGMVCAFLLAGAGLDINLETETTTENQVLLHPITGGEVNVVNTTTQTSKITLEDSIWVVVHYMFFIILLLYVIFQTLMRLTKLE